MERQLPISCPSCGEALSVTRFLCKTCDTVVEGEFELPLLMRLMPEERDLKALAKVYRVSYPTVRNRLDALRAKVEAMQEPSNQPSQEEQP